MSHITLPNIIHLEKSFIYETCEAVNMLSQVCIVGKQVFVLSNFFEFNYTLVECWLTKPDIFQANKMKLRNEGQLSFVLCSQCNNKPQRIYIYIHTHIIYTYICIYVYISCKCLRPIPITTTLHYNWKQFSHLHLVVWRKL